MVFIFKISEIKNNLIEHNFSNKSCNCLILFVLINYNKDNSLFMEQLLKKHYKKTKKETQLRFVLRNSEFIILYR